MTMFGKLFRKELKFMAVPAVGIFAVQIAIGSFAMLSYYHFYSFYAKYIHNFPQDSPFIWRILVFPVIMTASLIGMSYVFGAFFLYSLLNEHFTNAKYQLYSFPMRHWKHLAAKFAAICSWAMIIFIGITISVRASYLVEKVILKKTYPFIEYQPFDIMLLSTFKSITQIVFICSLVMIGYVVAMSIKRFPAFVGTVTVFAGYFFYRKFYSIMYSKFASESPWWEGLPVITPWFSILFKAAMAIMFIAASLFLYERFSEV